ncbi:succinyl-diaminopimelate desuccinylase [Demequina sp. TTPB684]|uniref:succinyl-diaminopimelate desuccinylase n=1 Tax=unclassified Demequina TaxID=2620311 RepID=UPI001CF124D7|nr:MULTISPECIES: succinyl-diaminopimelate desuccinylase [unclassified Demequina]MCB2411469.1 succinyl-diaminopimelate desuccinylase [Demequina sp. TTPB684]UPU87291.1 succinyl-diaminopimelate desuccinylase [Demequina sp. TMPB413]
MSLPVAPGTPVEDLARALIDIPSVSGDEQAIADAVEEALRSCGHFEVTRLGDSIVARTTLGLAERIIIAGHLDTVPIKDNVPSCLSDDGTEVIGRGAVDMKAGVAVQLALAVELAAPTRDVTWIFYDNEEVEASRSGLGRVVRERPDLVEGDFAILGEPTSAVIEGGCNGTLRCEVSLAGKAAHSARAWKGVNAVHLAAPLLTALSNHEAANIEVDGLAYREGLNAVRISGGIAGNVIPDECTVTINYRFAPGADVQTAKQRVIDFIDAAYAEADADAGAGAVRTVTWTDESAAARPGLDAAIAQDFVAAVAATGALPPRAKLGWTDVARFGELGIPAVNYGPGDPELAHASGDAERCPIEHMRACHAALKAWLTAPPSSSNTGDQEDL